MFLFLLKPVSPGFIVRVWLVQWTFLSSLAKSPLKRLYVTQTGLINKKNKLLSGTRGKQILLDARALSLWVINQIALLYSSSEVTHTT